MLRRREKPRYCSQMHGRFDRRDRYAGCVMILHIGLKRVAPGETAMGMNQ